MCHNGARTGDSRTEIQSREGKECNVVKVNPGPRNEVVTSTGDNEGKSDQKRKGSNDACTRKYYSARVTLSIMRLWK